MQMCMFWRKSHAYANRTHMRIFWRKSPSHANRTHMRIACTRKLHANANARTFACSSANRKLHQFSSNFAICSVLAHATIQLSITTSFQCDSMHDRNFKSMTFESLSLWIWAYIRDRHFLFSVATQCRRP